LDGVLDELRSDQLVDGISMDNLNAELGGDSDEERLGSAGLPGSSGKSRGGAGGMGAGDGARTTRPQILTAAVRFSPTGREWAAATTQGLQVFSLDDAMLFAPTELDASVTPQAVMRAIESKQFGKALTMALQLSLSETRELKAAVDAVPMAAIELVVKSLDPRMLKELLRFLAEELTLSRHIEFYLRWCWELLRSFGPTLQADAGRSMAHKQTLRALIRSISMHERESIRMADENGFYLQFLCSQLIPGEGEDNSAVELVKYTEDRVAQEVSINTVAKGEASSETTKRARQTKSRKVGVLSN
jgi:periodic tryptophan protein 2